MVTTYKSAILIVIQMLLLYYYYLFVPPLHFKFRNITDKQNSYTTRLPKYIDILIGMFLIIILNLLTI